MRLSRSRGHSTVRCRSSYVYAGVRCSGNHVIAPVYSPLRPLKSVHASQSFLTCRRSHHQVEAAGTRSLQCQGWDHDLVMSDLRGRGRAGVSGESASVLCVLCLSRGRMWDGSSDSRVRRELRVIRQVNVNFPPPRRAPSRILVDAHRVLACADAGTPLGRPVDEPAGLGSRPAGRCQWSSTPVTQHRLWPIVVQSMSSLPGPTSNALMTPLSGPRRRDGRAQPPASPSHWRARGPVRSLSRLDDH